MKLSLDYKPTPKQALFHRSKADEVLYGGAASALKKTQDIRRSGDEAPDGPIILEHHIPRADETEEDSHEAQP